MEKRLLASPTGFVGGGADLPDLSEDDVWPTFPNAHSAAEIDDDHRWPRADLSGDRRWTGLHVGGLSLAFEEPYRGPTAPPRRGEKRIAAAASAPMDVPAWPRHLRAGSGGPPPDPEVEDAAGAEWLPPHEYLARAHGRSAATASVLEGAGRTLKGRDMSRVRDAVWSQTGFFG
ncbi:protein S40-6-like [Curcuma longa]|uniref:protein S40-6-like n=1 Tax=Curcuma longa TaxID=136217 RepID=UPI003D9ED472